MNVKETNKLKQKRIAVIDTGSNTVRLAIFNVIFSDTKNVQIKEIVDIKNTAGLSNYLKNGEFSTSGIEKATRVLQEQIECAKSLKCDQIYVFATAVLRNAKNSKNAKLQIEKNINYKIDLLSSKDEAILGCRGAFFNGEKNTFGMLIDLGGGSCEITSFNNKSIDAFSLKMGCVLAYSNFVSGIFPTETERKKISREVKTMLKREVDKIKNGLTDEDIKERNMWGIGGSVRGVAKFTRELKKLNKTPKHVRFSDLTCILDFLSSDKNAFSHVAVKAVPDRIHTIVPGCIILIEIMKFFKVKQIDICKHGLREGYLISKLGV